MSSMKLPPELIQKYLVRRKQDSVDCDGAIVDQNSAVFERIGHQLKGNALTYGFPELGSIGEAMEIAAKDRNWRELELLTASFKQFLLDLPKAPEG